MCVHWSHAEKGTREGKNDEDQDCKTLHSHCQVVTWLGEVVQDKQGKVKEKEGMGSPLVWGD